MFNPYVPEEDIVRFLKRFVDIQGVGEKVIDKKKYWTGKRRYRVRFRTDVKAPDGLLHPPASFLLGSNRGYCYYYGQPAVCRRCGQPGHNVVDCREVVCRNCEGVGHLAAHCTEDVRCNLCGGVGHMFRDCTQRKKSFAAVVRDAGSASRAPEAGHQGGLEEEGSMDTEACAEVGRGETQTEVVAETSQESELTLSGVKDVETGGPSGLEVTKAAVGGISWAEKVEETEAEQVLTKHKAKRKNLEPEEVSSRKAGRSTEEMELESEMDSSVPVGADIYKELTISIPNFQDVLAASSCSPGPALSVDEAPVRVQEGECSLVGKTPEEVWFEAGIPSKFVRLCRWDMETDSVTWPEFFDGSVFERKGIRLKPVGVWGDLSTFHVYAESSGELRRKRYQLEDLLRDWIDAIEKDESNFEQKRVKKRDMLRANLVVTREFLNLCKLVHGNVVFPSEMGGITEMLRRYKNVRVEPEKSRERLSGLLVCGVDEKDIREVYLRFSCLVRKWAQKGFC
ncbi:ZCHC3 protein, partial [Atractosteus spatula]|nr:ZCHC3 protein [Atractosteus spatula]